MMDTVIPLPDGGEWIVRAFSYETREEQRGEWERVQYEHQGAESNFSIWSATDPEQTTWLVVLCGRRENLPKVSGEPYALDPEHARHFALRRARVGLDAEEAGLEKLSQEERYGLETPMTVDPATGRVVPYRQR